MKKIVIAIAALFTALGAQATCKIDYVGDLQKIGKALEKVGGFNFPGHDLFCDKLKQANAKLSIYAEHGVLGGKSIAWAAVGVRASRLPIDGSVVSQSTQLNDFGDHGKSIEILGTALNTAVSELDLDLALEKLNESRKAIALKR